MKINHNGIILLEGYHEEHFIKDWRANHGDFLNDVQMRVIPAGQINNYVITYIDSKDQIYFVVDHDVKSVNQKVIFSETFCQKNDIVFESIIANPEFGAFCAACFADFEIKPEWDTLEIKQQAKEFLQTKNHHVSLKKWCYSDILKNGGNLKNAHRYAHRFEILKFLKPYK